MLSEDGRVSITLSYGVSNRETGTLVTDDSMFRAGSIAKSLVGVVLLMLVEDGLLSPDDHVSARVPEAKFTNPWKKLIL